MARQSLGSLKIKLTNRLYKFSGTTFIRKKLNNWFGFLFISGIACLYAWLLAKNMLFGLGLFGGLLGFTLVILCFINVETGFFLLLFVGFFGYFFTSSVLKGVPIGVVYDGLVLINFIGLIVSRKDFKSTWKTFSKIPLVMLMWVIFFYFLLEMFNPNTMGVSSSVLQFLRKYLEYIFILFLAYILFNSYEKIRRYTIVLLIMSTVCAIYGCIQEWHGLFPWEMANIMADPMSFGLLWTGSGFRKFSTMSDPSVFGIVMAACSIFFIILGLYERNIRIKLTFIACSILMILAVGYSGTRTAYAVDIAGFAFFIILNIDKAAIRKFGVIMILVFLALQFGPFSNYAVIRRFRTTFIGTKDESYKVRLVNRAFIQPLIQSHPMGEGMGTTGFQGAIEHPGNPLANFQPDGAYVTRAAETGWVGLGVVILLYFITLRVGVRGFFRERDPRLKPYYSACVSTLFALYVGEYTQIAVGSISDAAIYFAFIAMMLNFRYNEQFAKTMPTPA